MALIFTGDDSYQTSGPPEWNRSLWDLDTLYRPYRGGTNNLDAFLNAHEADGNLQAPEDSNMFLVNATPDGHLQFPTVRLQYLGRKNGALPPPKHGTDDAVMSASSKRLSSGLFLTEP